MTCYTFEDHRYLRNRHLDDCDGVDCSGCRSCPERHCPECRQGRHLGYGENTCAECVGHTRADLHALLELYAALPAEAVERGVDSEAANLAGPATDAEAWSWRKAHLASTIGWDAIEDDDEHHPLNVLGRFVQSLGEDYGDPTDLTLDMSRAVDYLDARLGRIAHDAGQDFGQFKREVRRCRAHLEAVLHDSRAPEKSRVPCIQCGTLLTIVHASAAKDDHHKCPKCRTVYNAEEFRLAKAQWLASEGADRFVLLADAVKAVERPEFTIRTWLRRGLVSSMCDIKTHRLQVWWPDVRDTHQARRIADVKPKAG